MFLYDFSAHLNSDIPILHNVAGITSLFLAILNYNWNTHRDL